jgi:hypothetical protein
MFIQIVFKANSDRWGKVRAELGYSHNNILDYSWCTSKRIYESNEFNWQIIMGFTIKISSSLSLELNGIFFLSCKFKIDLSENFYNFLSFLTIKRKKANNEQRALNSCLLNKFFL